MGGHPLATSVPVPNQRRRFEGWSGGKRRIGASRPRVYSFDSGKNSSIAASREDLESPASSEMKLLIQPEHGAAPLIKAIDDAAKSIEIAIFRFDHTETER